jgi:hypothetical protein
MGRPPELSLHEPAPVRWMHSSGGMKRMWPWIESNKSLVAHFAPTPETLFTLRMN